LHLDKYKRFIFDFDGVVVDSNFAKEDAIKEAVKILEPSKTHHEFLDYFTNNNGLTREHKIKKYFNNSEGNRVLLRYSEILNKKFYECSLISGVEDFIRKLHKSKLSLIILSGGDEKEIKKYLNIKGLNNIFEYVLGGPVSKRDNLKNLTEVSESIFFGDSQVDYDLAKEFGLDFVFVYGASSMKNWKTKLNFPSNFTHIKDFGEIK